MKVIFEGTQEEITAVLHNIMPEPKNNSGEQVDPFIKNVLDSFLKAHLRPDYSNDNRCRIKDLSGELKNE